MKSITIIGRRWFQRGPGNTYHTSQIMIDGKTVHKTARQYGYGSAYLDTAFAWLEANGKIEPRERHFNGSQQAPWNYCQERGITLEYSAIDVSRQKDL